tara:strand:- start:1792 stop:2781 length:990 start_codon:yes stop_codon:yes gene_type:complete
VKQEVFERRYSSDWEQFEQWISLLSKRRSRADNDPERLQAAGKEFPARYREICHHLALARTRRYSIALQQRLNQLALDGHQQLYRSRTTFLSTLQAFVFREFPATFRRYWRYMLASTLLFYLPAFGMAIAINLQPELVFSFLSPADVSRMEAMYDPQNDVLGRERVSETDWQMFAYYIYNNITIGFQTFAGGLVFGLGSLFYLVFNGLFFGAVATHLTAVGYTSTFWPFVAGHSALELTAICIFGGVGLLIGYAGIAPGRRSRWHAIRYQATNGMPLVYGGVLMLVAAAFVEAFWSSTTWPPVMLKFVVGGALWLLLLLYFLLMGRHES